MMPEGCNQRCKMDVASGAQIMNDDCSGTTTLTDEQESGDQQPVSTPTFYLRQHSKSISQWPLRQKRRSYVAPRSTQVT
jgi:hypothetical protein